MLLSLLLGGLLVPAASPAPARPVAAAPPAAPAAAASGALSSPAAPAPSGTRAAPLPPATAGEAPLLRLVAAAFTTMASTRYQHHTDVDVAAGSYRFDCVGLVSWALRQATPLAWQALRQRMALAPGRGASPPTYERFFRSLQQRPAPGWQALPRVEDLRGGDVVSWARRTSHASGHALILAAAPQRLEPGLWQVVVFDATSTPHLQDSRPTDPRAQRFDRTGRPSGLGRGVAALVVDPHSGALLGFRWRPQGPTVLVPIAAARPLA